MKTKSLFALVAIVAATTCSLQNANAQNTSPFWSLAGNSNATGSSKLGTTNNIPLRLFTNNLERLRIANTTGNVGIGTITPSHAKLEINGSIGAAVAMFGADKNGVTIQADNPEVGFNFYYDGTTDRTIKAGFASVIGMLPSSGDVYIGNFSGNKSSSNFGSISGYKQAITLKQNGIVGIGTTTPSHAKLELTGSVGAAVAMFGSDKNGVTIEADNPEVGFNFYYDGTTDRTIKAGFASVIGMLPSNGDVYIGNFNGNKSSSNFGSISGYQQPLVITQVGNVGIGLEPINTSGFNDAKLQVSNDGDDNLRLVAADNSNDWSMYSVNGTSGPLDLFKNGNLRGTFDATTGAYSSFSTPFSDEKFKKDITVLPDVMEKLMKLQPKEYHFKENTTSATGYSYGFIAQEVNKIFPEFVTTIKDRKTGQDMLAINYNNFSVIAIKAIQELSSQNDSLKQSNQALNDKLNALSNKIDQIESAMSQCCNSFSSSMQNTGSNSIQSKISAMARLDQNIPNPFNNTTSISYYIPTGFHNAQLMITDVSGHVLKTYSITQTGSGRQTISGNELTSGMYQYSLLINGKVVDTKKMVISK